MSPASLTPDGVALRKDITVADLVVAPNEVTFVNFESWEPQDLNHVFPASKGYRGGHYVLLSDVRPADREGVIEVEFNDPLRGTIKGKLRKVRPAQFGIDTFLVTFDWREGKGPLSLVTNLIRVKVQLRP